MERTEPGYGSMVRSRKSFEKIHEADITGAGSLDITGRIEAVHGRIDDYLEHLSGRHRIFPYAVIGRIKIRQIKFLHELT